MTYVEYEGVGFEVDPKRGLVFLPAKNNSVRRAALMNELLDEEVVRIIVRTAREVEAALT